MISKNNSKKVNYERTKSSQTKVAISLPDLVQLATNLKVLKAITTAPDLNLLSKLCWPDVKYQLCRIPGY